MHIDRSEFGSVTIDGKTYDHDITIDLSGHVRKRRKQLSEELYGTSHVVSEDEARDMFDKGSDLLIIGSGQQGNVQLSPEAAAYLAREKCKVLLQPTQEAIESYNRAQGHKIALMHVTC